MQRQEEAAALQPTHLVPLLLHVEHCISCDKHAFCTRHPVFATRCDIEGDVDGPASELTYTVRCRQCPPVLLRLSLSPKRPSSLTTPPVSQVRRRAHSVAEAMDGVERRPPNASPACVVVETEYSRAADRLEETVWKTFPEGGVTFNTVAAAGGDAKDGTTTAVPVVDARLLPPSDPVTGKVVDRWVPLDRDSDASREQGARTWHWLRGAHAPRAPRLSAFEVTAHWPGWGPPVALHSKLASGSFPSLSPRPGSGMSLFAARALLAVARVHAQQLARMCDRTRPVGAPSAALFQALARGREEDAHRGAASPLAQWGRRRFEEETSRSVPALGPSSASRSPASAVGQGARRGAAGPAVAREGAGQMWSPRAEDDGRGGDLRHTPPDSPIPAVEASAAEAEAPGKAAPLDPWQRVPFFVAVGALDRAVALWGAQAPPEEVRERPVTGWERQPSLTPPFFLSPTACPDCAVACTPVGLTVLRAAAAAGADAAASGRSHGVLDRRPPPPPQGGSVPAGEGGVRRRAVPPGDGGTHTAGEPPGARTAVAWPHGAPRWPIERGPLAAHSAHSGGRGSGSATGQARSRAQPWLARCCPTGSRGRREGAKGGAWPPSQSTRGARARRAGTAASPQRRRGGRCAAASAQQSGQGSQRWRD